jgi:hypothetical protein
MEPVHVPFDLAAGKGADLRPHRDPLVELAKRGQRELLLELPLADKDDLEELALLRLQVREEPHLLEE